MEREEVGKTLAKTFLVLCDLIARKEKDEYVA